MNTKTLVAALVGAVAAFLLGWVVFGMLLDPFFRAHTNEFNGLMKDMQSFGTMSYLGIFIANLAWTFMIALICSWSNMVGFMKGAVIGATLGFCMQLSFDLFNSTFMNLYKDSTIIVVDVIANTVFFGIIGGIIGWWMGRGTKEATVAAV